MTLFTGRFFSQEFRPRFEFKELFNQCYIIGYSSLPLVGLTGFIMGLVLTMQLRPSLVVYGVQSQLPLMDRQKKKDNIAVAGANKPSIIIQ